MVVKTAVLKELETLYAKSGNQLCVLYGRPDLEKELLLKTFLQNKKAPIKGPEGNIEYLGWLQAGDGPAYSGDLKALVQQSHAGFEEGAQ